MQMKPSDSEFTLWLGTSPDQRSFLIEVLHWFYYRPAALKQSWVREEALTWELLRALEVLPQSLFLRPILAHLASLSLETRAALKPLLTTKRVTITRYPSLKLAGAKRNSRSDIGVGLAGGPTVWIEAKTAPFKERVFRAQLFQQREALTRIFPNKPTAVITLLPSGMSVPGFGNISWSVLADLLERGITDLRTALPNNDYHAGYEHVALETVRRIRSHPNKIINTS